MHTHSQNNSFTKTLENRKNNSAILKSILNLIIVRPWLLRWDLKGKWKLDKERFSEWVKIAQSCPTVCDPMEYTFHGIIQTRILEWVAFPFSRASSQPRDWIRVFHFAGRVFTSGLNHKESPRKTYGFNETLWKCSMTWCMKCDESSFMENPQITWYVYSFKYFNKEVIIFLCKFSQKMKEGTLTISLYVVSVTLIQDY